MTTAQEASRAAFEAWFTAEYPDPAFLNRRDFEGSTSFGEYCTHEVEMCWRGWQAATAVREQEIARLRKALTRAADMLGSAAYFVSPNNGLRQVLEAQEAARAALETK